MRNTVYHEFKTDQKKLTIFFYVLLLIRFIVCELEKLKINNMFLFI